jgi:hypothetical protein
LFKDSVSNRKFVIESKNKENSRKQGDIIVKDLSRQQIKTSKTTKQSGRAPRVEPERQNGSELGTVFEISLVLDLEQ